MCVFKGEVLMLFKRLLMLPFTAALLMSNVASAKETGWITGREFWKKSQKIDAMGWMPTKVHCRDSGAPQLDLASAFVNVEYEPNTERVSWSWMGSTNLHDDVPPMEAQGYKLVSKDTFVRAKTGLRIYCLIFHKE